MKIITLKILLILSTSILAQKPGIRGEVFSNKKQKGLKNTSIYLFQNDNLIDSTITSKNGAFNFNGLSPNNYSILLKAKKHQTKKIINIELGNSSLNLNTIYLDKEIQLKPTSCEFKEE